MSRIVFIVLSVYIVTVGVACATPTERSPEPELTDTPVGDASPVAASSPGAASTTPAAVAASVIALQTSTPNTPACGTGALLTHLPLELYAYDYIVPLGNLNPPSHVFPTTHIYFGLKWEESGLSQGLFGDGRTFPPQDVYAVADARITSLAVSDIQSMQSGTPENYREFDLRMEVCEGLEIRYGHIGPISERLQELLETAEPWSCHDYETGAWEVERCEYRVDWKVVSGEQIAFTSGRAATFDMGASKSPDPSSKPETICPIDLYDAASQALLRADLGLNEIRRTIEPLCGTVSHIVEGTAQGRWWFGDRSDPIEDQNIALVYDNIDPRVPVFSIGTSVKDVASSAYRFIPADSGKVNRPFTSVVPDAGVFCYERLTNGSGQLAENLTLLVQMVGESQVGIEAVAATSCGAGPWQLSENATYFSR